MQSRQRQALNAHRPTFQVLAAALLGVALLVPAIGAFDLLTGRTTSAD